MQRNLAAYAGARNNLATRDTTNMRSAMQKGAKVNTQASQEMLY